MTADTDTVVQAIRRLEDERYQAMLDGNVAALERLLDPEVVYTHSSGTADSKTSYIDGIRNKIWAYRDIGRDDETIVVRDNLALVFNRLRIKIDVRGARRELDNRALAVWARGSDGNWRMLALHSTPSQPPAA